MLAQLQELWGTHAVLGQSLKLAFRAACSKSLTAASRCIDNSSLLSRVGSLTTQHLIFPKGRRGWHMSMDLYKKWAAPAWAISPLLFGKLSLLRASIMQTPIFIPERKGIYSGCLSMLTQTLLFFSKFYFKMLIFIFQTLLKLLIRDPRMAQWNSPVGVHSSQ